MVSAVLGFLGRLACCWLAAAFAVAYGMQAGAAASGYELTGDDPTPGWGIALWYASTIVSLWRWEANRRAAAPQHARDK